MNVGFGNYILLQEILSSVPVGEGSKGPACGFSVKENIWLRLQLPSRLGMMCLLLLRPPTACFLYPLGCAPMTHLQSRFIASLYSLFLYFLKVLKHDLEEYIFPPIRPLREFVSCLGIHHLTYCIS